MTGQAIRCKLLERWGVSWVRDEGRQRCNGLGRGGPVALHGVDTHAGCQIGLGAEGMAHLRNRAGIGGLDAGVDPLDVIAPRDRIAAVTLGAAARDLHHGQIGRIAATVHPCVGQVGIQRQPIAAVAGGAAEGRHRMRRADFFDAVVAGEAEFGPVGQGRDDLFGRRLAGLPSPGGEQDHSQDDRGRRHRPLASQAHRNKPLAVKAMTARTSARKTPWARRPGRLNHSPTPAGPRSSA